jgi:tetratricopeptide (TPR) repeat protein
MLVGRIIDFGGLPAALVIALSLYGADLAEMSHQAKEAMVAGNFRQAVLLYRELVKALPDNPGLRMNLGLALHSAGRYREAIPNFQTVAKQVPDAWLFIGLDHLKLGQPELAIAPLEKVVAADEKNEEARLELAEAFLESGKPRQAAARFETLVKLDPENAKGWHGLGLAYQAQSRETFTELEKLSQDSAWRDVLFARSLVERGRIYSAFRLYHQALVKDPGLRGVHAGIAEVYRRSNHPDWVQVEEDREKNLPAPQCAPPTLECDFVARRYQTILERTHGDHTAEALYWQSQAWSRLSEQCFEQLARMPSSGAIHELMADAYRIQGKYDQAVQEWRDAQQISPADQRVTAGLARALWLNREFDEARPMLDELVKHQPESADLNFELGDVLLNVDDIPKAVHYLETAIKLAPGQLQAHASLGRAYTRAGQPLRAIPHLKAAAALDPNGRGYYTLSQAYEAAGQKELGREALRKYREISADRRERETENPEAYEITPPR